MRRIFNVLIFSLLLSGIVFAQNGAFSKGNNGSIESIPIAQFNFDNNTERMETTSGSDLYAYFTFDDEYFYFGFSGNTPSGPVTDNDRVYHIYIDTDPKENPTQGTGTTDGEAWRYDPSISITANYHYAFKTFDNSEYRRAYSDGWTNTEITTENYKDTDNSLWKMKMERADLGSPEQIHFIAYVEEDWDVGSICGGLPSNLFTNTSGGGGLTFNSHWKNYYLLSDLTHNHTFHNDNYEWIVRLGAATGSISDQNIYAGMAVNATNGFDSTIDLPQAPLPPSSYVQVYFPHTDWSTVLGPNFKRDIKDLISLNETTSLWNFKVNTDQTNSDITLTLDEFDYVPSNYDILLIDLENDSTHNIRNQGTYTYNSGTRSVERAFRLKVGVTLTSPTISLSSDSLNFGTVKTNEDSTLTLEITNTGDSTLVISNIVSSHSVFTFTGSTAHNIAKDSILSVDVTFDPVASGSYDETLTISSNDPNNSSAVVKLAGTAQQLVPGISAGSTSLNYGTVKVDYDSSITVQVYNTGDTTLTVSNVTTTNSVFSITSATNFRVFVNDSSALTIKFNPQAVTTYTDSVELVSDAPGQFFIAVQGTGSGAEISKSVSAGWTMFSVPVTPDNPATSQVIGDDILSYILYTYNPGGGYTGEDTIELGHGYWLGLEEAASIDVSGTPSVDSVTFALQAGPNMIATPYVRQYEKSVIYFRKDAEIKSISEAASAGWVQNVLYNYRQSDSSYVSSDTLSQWAGYWIPALTTGVSTIFYHDSTTGSPIEKSNFDQIDENNWYATINALANGAKDILLSFGVSEDAADGFDPVYDFVKPPLSPAPNALETYFSQTSWSQYFSKFASDIKSPFEGGEFGKNWSFNVSSRMSGQVILNWENILEQIPEEIRTKYRFVLNGPGIGAVPLNMLETFKHQFNAESGVIYTFSINSVSTDVEDDGIEEINYELEQNYPNPFNPETTIRFSIPESGQVKLVVFNSLGEEIITLVDSPMQRGKFSVKWNGRNNAGQEVSSGVYLYKITSGDFIQTRKMILMR